MDLKISKKQGLIFFDYITIIVMILQFNTVWSTFYIYYSTFLFVLLILDVIIILVFLLLYNKGSKDISKYLTWVLFIVFYIFFHYFISLINGAKILEYIRLLIIIILAFTIYYFKIGFSNNNFKEFILRFINVMTVYAFFSIFLWLFISYFGILKYNQTFESSWGKSIYYGWNNIFFMKEPEIFSGKLLIRNIGIFTEAPMYSFLLCTAFLYLIFLDKSNSIVKPLILLFAIFTTYSITGFIIVISSIIIKITLFSKNKFHSLIKIFIPLFLVVALIIIIYLFNQKLDTSSGITRLDDFKIGFLSMKDSFLFGWGYLNSEYVEKYTLIYRLSNNGLSNSLSTILIYGGIYLFLPYFILFIKAFLPCIKRHDYNRLFFIVFYSIMFLITNVPFNIITILLLFSLSYDYHLKDYKND